MNQHAQYLEEIAIRGFTLIEEVLEAVELQIIRDKMDALLEADIQRFTREHLLAVREFGTLRFMMLGDRYFLGLINLRPVMNIIEALLGPTCILHLQNGIIPLLDETHQQSEFHQDYRRWMNGFNVSFNAFLMIDEFTLDNGATYVVPGTHLCEQKPSAEYMNRYGEQVTGRAGSAVIFNSRLWHRGGANRTAQPRRAINMQYTPPYVRQQVDYTCCLPEEEYERLPEREQQLLGRFVRLPKDTDEFRVPTEKRLYRAGQG